jgi:hypothetical protein
MAHFVMGFALFLRGAFGPRPGQLRAGHGLVRSAAAQ